MLYTRTSKVLPILVLASVLPTFAQTTTYGGRGIFRVFSARNVQAGSFITNSHLSAFLRNGENSGRINDSRVSIGLTYGIRDNLELTAQLVPFQSDHVENRSGIGATRFGLKWQMPIRVSRLGFGIRTAFRLPTDGEHGIAAEPYSEDAVAWSVSGVVSGEFGRADRKHALDLDLNVGYQDQNIGTFLSGQSTDQLLLGLGYKVPMTPFIYFGEYTTEIFLNNDVAFRENSMRLTQGVRFKIPFDIFADVGFEYRLNKETQQTTLPGEFSRWKAFLGFSYHFTTKRVPMIPVYTDGEIMTSTGVESLQQLERRKSIEEELRQMREELDAPQAGQDKAEKK